MIEVTSALPIQIVNFIVLILLMNLVLYRPVRKILKERKNKVQGLEEAIESSQRDVAESEEVFKGKMSGARKRGGQEKEAMEQAGQAEERRIIDEINEKARADLDAVRAQIARDAEQAKRKLEGEIKGFSVAIAEKILGRAVS